MSQLTRYNEVDGGSRIPVKAHRVTQHQLRLWLLGGEFLAALAAQTVDVVRQAQQLAAHIFHLQLQEVAAALDLVNTLHHVNHTYQRELSAKK